MNIYARKGHRVVFLGYNGYPSELAHAKTLLSVGSVYTVDHTNVYSSSTSVKLVEFPKELFNSVMFEDHKE